MAISRTVRPTVIVSGVLVRRLDRNRRDGGTRYATEYTLAQESGAQVAFTAYDVDGQAVELGKIGDFLAVEASVEESQQYGAALRYEGTPFDTLDRIHSGLAVAAK